MEGPTPIPLDRGLVVPVEDLLAARLAGSFIVTPLGYRLFMRESRLDEVAQGVLEGIDLDSTVQLQWAARQMHHLVVSAPLPETLYDVLRKASRTLESKATSLAIWAPDRAGVKAEDLTAIRPAAWAERPAETLRAVQECWADWSNWRRLRRRREMGVPLLDMNAAILVRPEETAEQPALERVNRTTRQSFAAA